MDDIRYKIFHPGECIKIGIGQYQVAEQLLKPHEMKTMHYTQFLCSIPSGVGQITQLNTDTSALA